MSDLTLQRVGPTFGGSGTAAPLRGTITGAQVVSDAHGRFQEAALQGNLYTFGLSNTALVAANAIATGLTATAQPVIGVWNPLTSGKNLVILQANVIVTTVANSAVAPGGFMWVSSVTNGAITTGSTPINCKTLVASGSVAKSYAVSTALTGLTVNLAVLRAAAIAPFNAAGAATAVSLLQGNAVDNVDGSIVVPPGGVVGIMNQVSTTTCSVSVSLLWEEIPVLV